MDFNLVEKEHFEDEVYNPYAGKINGEWVEGSTSVSFLNNYFGKYETAEEMKNATKSEGLKLYFDWLADEGKIPKN